jgi:putative heme-binding domain-containing protein
MQMAIQHPEVRQLAMSTAEIDYSEEQMCALMRALWLHMPEFRGPVAAQFAVYPSDLVRACLARLLGELEWGDRMDSLLLLACNHRAGDRASLESLGIGARGYESEFLDLMAEAVELGEINEAAYRDLLWRLHPVGAVEPMLARAMDASLDHEARMQMVDGIAFCEAREAADAMFVLWHAGPGDTHEQARWWFQNRSENLWRQFTPEVSAGDFGSATRRWSSGVMGQGLRDVDVDVSAGQRLWLVVTDGGDGDACDWADWLDPVFLMEDESTVPVRGWDLAEQGWGMTRLDKSAGGGLLQVADMVFHKGIGTHANARILVAVPPGAQRFKARVGPDLGGSSQGCGSTIEFQVWVESVDAEVAVDPRRHTVTDASAAWEEREQAARGLAADPEGGLFLLAKAEQGQLPERLIVAATEAIYSNTDLGVRALATAHFPRAGMETLPTVAEILALDASAERGREVFRSEVARCASCHAHTGLGLDIGPDLTAIRSKYGRAEILDAILNPSAAIAFGYDTYLVQTTDDEYISGFLLAEGEDVILKDTLGDRYVIPASDIAHKKKQELSVMPEGLAMGMGAQDLADLVAFLSRDPEREPDFGDPVRLLNGEDFTGWTHHLGGSAERDDVWSVEDGVLRCNGRPAGYVRTEADHLNYELTLEWRFDPNKGAGNSGVLCRMTGRDKVWPRSMEAQLQSGSAGDIWNIDAYPMLTDPGRTNGRHTRGLLGSSEKPLGEWNRYRLLVDRGYLRLEVNGVLQNEAFWCEEVPGKICLQSEGAYIEFRNIVLRPILD